jgi:hypothetical protein
MRRRVALLVLLVLIAAACGGGADDEPTASTTPPVIEASTTSSQTPDPVTTSSTPATTTATAAPTTAVQACADVVGATIERSGSAYQFSATVRSGDTGWDKYADAWIVRTADGAVLGERVLAHPHETEQPFTRSLSGVEIPTGIDEVEIAARDSVNGFCGEVFVVAVPS